MPIAGSDHALMFAQSGVARAGATRSGYASSTAFVSVNGVQIEPSLTAKVILGSLTITDALDELPNRLAMTVYGATPTKGQEVIATLGSVNNRSRLFAGQILTADRILVEHTDTLIHRVSAIDYTWLADRRLVTKRYTNQSATDIAQDLVATFTSGFTFANVVTGLATIDEITFTNQSVSSALTALAKRAGGYWYWDYLKDLHFFLTEADNNPVDLTTALASLTRFEHSTDLSQVLTRIYVEGYGSTALAEAAVGDTEIQIVDEAFYSSSGGLVVSGPQHISYTAIGSGNILSPLWVTVTPPNITTPKWGAAAYSPSLRRFVIAGTAKVATSPDGLTWTEQVASWAGQATGIVWAAELSLFVLVTLSGEVETSPTGITWTSQTPAAANAWGGIVWAPELSGGLLVAVASSGASRVMTSPDGITWTPQTAASALAWWAVSWSASLGILVAVAAQSGATSAMSSTDGVTWISRTPSDTGNAWFGVTWSPTVGKFVAAGSTGGIMYSSNGTAWVSIADRSGAANAMSAVLWVAEESRYVAVIYNTTRVFTSTDAITWAEEVVPTGEWGLDGSNGIAYGNGTTIIVGDDPGNIICANVSDHFATLTGIPASGAGSIAYAIAEGDDVNILEQVDDAAAQAALATLLGTGDGIVEDAIQDRRLSKTEAQARGTAALALRSTAEESLRYTVRDVRSKSGKTITFNFAGVTGTFKIQEVVIAGFNNDGVYPTYQAKASSTRFSLEDLLRSVRQKDAA